MRAAIVCGSRDWTDVAMLRGVLDELRDGMPEEEWLLVIEGQAPRADRMAGKWADEMIRRNVGHAKFAADWSRYGNRAGPLRNRQMLAHLTSFRDERSADVEVVAFSDTADKPGSGTAHMLKIAKAAGVRTTLHTHNVEAPMGVSGPPALFPA